MSVDPHERARLRELGALDLGADIEDPALQRLVEQAARELAMPLAAISIILDAAQYFVASYGLPGWIAQAQGTPREWAFCEHALARQAPFIVEDAITEPLVQDNPLVRESGIRCYLGYPLRTANDQLIGTLCVLGVQPRQFVEHEIARLGQLAMQVMAVLEARR